jgi:hypothetical protein
MKLDPGMHIGVHLVFFGKSGVTPRAHDKGTKTHGKGTKTHGKDFAVRFSSGCAAKGAR